MHRIMIAAAAITLAAAPAFAQGEKPANSIQGQYDTSKDPGRFDLDHDGTLSLAEAKSAAAYQFNKLDPDSDGTLDRQEVGKRLSDAEFDKANPDHDKTLDKAEYLALVEHYFTAAAGGRDKTIKVGDLASTEAGKRLLSLLQ
jgi:hypothetical protein